MYVCTHMYVHMYCLLAEYCVYTAGVRVSLYPDGGGIDLPTCQDRVTVREELHVAEVDHKYMYVLHFSNNMIRHGGQLQGLREFIRNIIE